MNVLSFLPFTFIAKGYICSPEGKIISPSKFIAAIFGKGFLTHIS
ncbi:MAG: hypothetical protein WCN27_03525 [Alphaproteobacteria bacterium]